MSKVIAELLLIGFALLHHVIGLRYLFNQSDAKPTNRDLVYHTLGFPALGAGYVYFLLILIGSLRCLRFL